eukprot:5593430-Pyramimonas_sp.AAC.1
MWPRTPCLNDSTSPGNLAASLRHWSQARVFFMTEKAAIGKVALATNSRRGFWQELARRAPRPCKVGANAARSVVD